MAKSHGMGASPTAEVEKRPGTAQVELAREGRRMLKRHAVQDKQYVLGQAWIGPKDMLLDWRFAVLDGRLKLSPVLPFRIL